MCQFGEKNSKSIDQKNPQPRLGMYKQPTWLKHQAGRFVVWYGIYRCFLVSVEKKNLSFYITKPATKKKKKEGSDKAFPLLGRDVLHWTMFHVWHTL